MATVRERIAEAQKEFDEESKNLDAIAFADKEAALAECHDRIRKINETRDYHKESLIASLVKAVLG